jgi:hypothetical protein
MRLNKSLLVLVAVLAVFSCGFARAEETQIVPPPEISAPVEPGRLREWIKSDSFLTLDERTMSDPLTFFITYEALVATTSLIPVVVDPGTGRPGLFVYRTL